MSLNDLETIKLENKTKTHLGVIQSEPDSSFVDDKQTVNSDGDNVFPSTLQYAKSEFNKNRQILITNIPVVTHEQVKEFVGGVSAQDVIINTTSRQAVVKLSDGSEAEQLVAKLDGCRLLDTPVSVALNPCYTLLCLTQLPADFDDSALRRLVSRYGEVQRCFLMRNSKGESKGYGFVEYVNNRDKLNHICQQLDSTKLPRSGCDSAATTAGGPDSTAAPGLGSTVVSTASAATPSSVQANSHEVNAVKMPDTPTSSTSAVSATPSSSVLVIRCGLVPPHVLRFEQLHSQCLRVDNLPPNYKNIMELRSLLSQYGMPPYCQLGTRNGQPLGFGVVEYLDPAVAEETQARINGASVLGSAISLTFCVPGSKAIDIYNKMMASLEHSLANQSGGSDPSRGGPKFAGRSAGPNLTTPLMQNLLSQNPQALHSFQDVLRQLQHKVYMQQQMQRPGLLGIAPNNAPPNPLHNPNLQIAILAVMMATQLQQSQPGLSGNHLVQQSMLTNLAQNQVPVGGGHKSGQTKKPSLLGNPMIAQASSMLQSLNAKSSSDLGSCDPGTHSESQQTPSSSAANWQQSLNNFGALFNTFQQQQQVDPSKQAGLLGNPPLLNLPAMGAGGGFLAGLPTAVQKLVAEAHCTAAAGGGRHTAPSAAAGGMGGANPVLALFIETQIRQQLQNLQRINQSRQMQQQQQQQQPAQPPPPPPPPPSASPRATPANEDDSAGALTRTGLLGKRPMQPPSHGIEGGRLGGKKALLDDPPISRVGAHGDESKARTAYGSAAYSSGVANNGAANSYQNNYNWTYNSTSGDQHQNNAASSYAQYENYGGYESYDYSKAYSQSDYQQWQSMYGQDANSSYAATNASATSANDPTTSSAHDSSYSSSVGHDTQTGYESYNTYESSYDSAYSSSLYGTAGGDSSADYSGQWSSYGYGSQPNGSGGSSEWASSGQAGYTGYADYSATTNSEQTDQNNAQQLTDYYDQLNSATTAGYSASAAVTTSSNTATSDGTPAYSQDYAQSTDTYINNPASAAYMQHYQQVYQEYLKQYAASMAQQQTNQQQGSQQQQQQQYQQHQQQQQHSSFAFPKPPPPPPPGETVDSVQTFRDSTPVDTRLVGLSGTPIGQKRTAHLLPSPEASPQGGYIGQHSQGIGGHYAETYAKRRRL